jgi:hypothetical protein
VRPRLHLAFAASVTGLVFVCGCTSAREAEDEHTGSHGAALTRRAPHDPEYRKPPPTDPSDPFYVGDAGGDQNILADEKNFYDRWFAAPCPLFAQVLNRCDDVAVQYIDTSFETGETNLWGWGSQAAALVQMYDLVAPIDRAAAKKYITRLRAMADAFLRNRDDLRHGPVDTFRGTVMPAWGLVTKDRDFKWNTDVVLAGVMTYPMAAFARRVAENPDAFPESEYPGFHAAAVRFINATMETYQGFRPEMHLEDGDPWAYHKMPESYASLICITPNDDDDIERSCKNYRDQAGDPIAWNEDLSLTKALAEVAVAADTPFFRATTDESIVNAFSLHYATKEAPLLVAKNFEFFYAHVTTRHWSDGAPYVVWNHQYWGDPRIQDTTHGSFELASIATLFEDRDRLNRILQNEGHDERLVISAARLRPFATTFLRLIYKPYDPNFTTGSNLLAMNVDGSGGASQYANSSEDCAGLVTLTVFDSWVWTRCRDVTYYFKSPFTGTGWADVYVQNHAALLRYRPRSPGAPRFRTDLGDALVTSPGVMSP